MELLNKDVYDDWKNMNTDPYVRECFNYAERWADLLEKRMAEGDELEAIAKETSREADTSGITGFMYGMAVSILLSCWKHGDELRRWHNLDTQIGDEGERANQDGGVLNPAVLNIRTK